MATQTVSAEADPSSAEACLLEPESSLDSFCRLLARRSSPSLARCVGEISCSPVQVTVRFQRPFLAKSHWLLPGRQSMVPSWRIGKGPVKSTQRSAPNARMGCLNGRPIQTGAIFLLVPQGHQRIDARRATGGNVTRQKRHKHEDHDHTPVGPRIIDAHAEEQTGELPRQSERNHDSQGNARDCEF